MRTQVAPLSRPKAHKREPRGAVRKASPPALRAAKSNCGTLPRALQTGSPQFTTSGRV